MQEIEKIRADLLESISTFIDKEEIDRIRSLGRGDLIRELIFDKMITKSLTDKLMEQDELFRIKTEEAIKLQMESL